MSLVPNATQTAPGAPIYAPVSGGGGGGGGSNFGTINVSSINFPSLGAPTQINFQPGVAVTNADTIKQTCASGLTSYISIDPFGNDTPSSNSGILIQGSNVAALELSCSGSTSAIELYGGGNYLSIDTCIPNAFRVQFADSGVPANPGMSTIGTLQATAIGGFKMLDSNLSTWTLSLSSLNVSSINGAAPGGGGLPANIVCSTLGVVSAAIIDGGITTQNLYTNGAGAAVSINTAPGAASGVISLETQTATGVAIGLQEQTGASGFSLVCDTPGTYMSALGKFALSNVSSINGAPVGSASAFNVAAPFTTGSDSGGTWQLQVNSNTGGVPQYLTAAVPVSTNHSYLVCVNLVSGSNTDTSSIGGNPVITNLKVATAGGGGNDLTLKTFPGFSNYWIYNGNVGSLTTIVRNTASVRLYATNTSPTNNTFLYFDTLTGMSVTDLGVSS